MFKYDKDNWIYCDICGGGYVELNEYILPTSQPTEILNQKDQIIYKNYSYKPREMRICDRCATEIGKAVRGAREILRMYGTVKGVEME